MSVLVILLSIVAVLTSGCEPFMIVGGAAGAGTAIAKNQTIGSTIDDKAIWTRIKSAFLSHNKEVVGILSNISVEVSEGRVLLTGYVMSADDRLKVLKIVWDQTGVREVINELKIKDGKYGFKTYSSDVWITTKVKAKLFGNKEIASVNYTIETVNSVVYILGIASSEEELNLVVSEVEKVENVEKVVPYVKVKVKQDALEKTSELNENKSEETSEVIEIKQEDSVVTEKETNVHKENNVKPEPVEIIEEDEHVIEIGQDSE